MNRNECLDAAKAATTKERQIDYGTPEDNFTDIAEMWRIYFVNRQFNPQPHDVAAMLIMVKLCRIKTSSKKDDNWVDIAGYAACGAEVTYQNDSCEQS